MLAKHDLLVVLGADPVRMSVWSEVEPLPDGLPVVHIGLVDWDMGKNFAAELAVQADVRETLLALTPLLKKQGGERLAGRAKAALAQLAQSNWTAKRGGSSPNASQARARRQADRSGLAVAADRRRPAARCGARQRGPHLGALHHRPGALSRPLQLSRRWHRAASAGALPAAVGVAFAQAPRPVCCFSGDGSAMYSIQALWTAANAKLPITYVIANNGGYRIIKQRLKAFHGSERYVGMDFEDPTIDFAALARSLGMPAERISEPDALAPALRRAFATPGPKLLDVVVDGQV